MNKITIEKVYTNLYTNSRNIKRGSMIKNNKKKDVSFEQILEDYLRR